MLILMNLKSDRESIEIIKDQIKASTCTPHEIPGARKLAIGITGPTNRLKEEDFLKYEFVDEVVRVTHKYKLVSREMKQDDTELDFEDEKIGGENLTVIAGPCSVESRQQLFDIAGPLKEMGIKFFRGGAYKPRSSPYSFQGLKEKGLELLNEVKKEFGLKIVTEVMSEDKIDIVSETADILQIGARNMQNFNLIEKSGLKMKPILLKRGMSSKIEELLLSAEYIALNGNYDIILCERGIRTFETAARNTLDLNAVPIIKKHSHLPVFVDPSHGIGIAEKVPAMSLAGVAAGADGLLIEVHNDPKNALSDGFQSLTIEAFADLYRRIGELAPLVGKKI